MALLREEINRFLAERRNAVLGKICKDRSPQLNPMWLDWTGEVFYISTTRTRVKYTHLKRVSRVTLCIDDATGYKTLIVEGRAEIIATDIWGLTRHSDEKYVDSAQVATRMQCLRSEPCVRLMIRPEKWRSWELAQRSGPTR